MVDSQRIVQILRDTRDERYDEIGDWQTDDDDEMVKALKEDVAALDYLLEGVGPDDKPRIVALLANEPLWGSKDLQE